MQTVKMLNLKEISVIMDISMRTVYRLATSGKIPAKKVGGVWRVDPIKLDLYLKTEWDKNSGEY